MFLLQKIFDNLLSSVLVIFTLFSNIISCIDIDIFDSQITNALVENLICIGVAFLIAFFVKHVINKIRNKIRFTGRNYIIQVEYGDLLKCKDKGNVVINFDECFTTKIGEDPEDIKEGSLCGQYLKANPINNINDLLEKKSIKSLESPSKFRNQKRYEPGTIVVHNTYFLMAFAKLDEKGKAYISYEDYLKCLDTLWKEINGHFTCKDVYIPVLGDGLTNILDRKLTKQELVDIIISSYKLSNTPLKPNYCLHIVCMKSDNFSLNNVGKTL